MLLVWIGESTIKRWPEHPQKYCTDHSDEIAIVVAFALELFVFDGIFGIKEVRGSDAEVGPEGVHIHGSTYVDSTKFTGADGLIQAPKEDFKGSEEPELT